MTIKSGPLTGMVLSGLWLFFALGYIEGKGTADRWYAAHPLEKHIVIPYTVPYTDLSRPGYSHCSSGTDAWDEWGEVCHTDPKARLKAPDQTPDQTTGGETKGVISGVWGFGLPKLPEKDGYCVCDGTTSICRKGNGYYYQPNTCANVVPAPEPLN